MATNTKITADEFEGSTGAAFVPATRTSLRAGGVEESFINYVDAQGINEFTQNPWGVLTGESFSGAHALKMPRIAPNGRRGGFTQYTWISEANFGGFPDPIISGVEVTFKVNIGADTAADDDNVFTFDLGIEAPYPDPNFNQFYLYFRPTGIWYGESYGSDAEGNSVGYKEHFTGNTLDAMSVDYNRWFTAKILPSGEYSLSYAGGATLISGTVAPAIGSGEIYLYSGRSRGATDFLVDRVEVWEYNATGGGVGRLKIKVPELVPGEPVTNRVNPLAVNVASNGPVTDGAAVVGSAETAWSDNNPSTYAEVGSTKESALWTRFPAVPDFNPADEFNIYYAASNETSAHVNIVFTLNAEDPTQVVPTYYQGGRVSPGWYQAGTGVSANVTTTQSFHIFKRAAEVTWSSTWEEVLQKFRDGTASLQFRTDAPTSAPEPGLRITELWLDWIDASSTPPDVESEVWKFANPRPGENNGTGRLKVYTEEGWRRARAAIT